jgi:hypothetical protein
VGLAVAGRWRLAVAAGAGIAVVLAAVGAAVAAGLLDTPFARLGLHGPGNTLASLSENFWSGRVIEWLGIAGVAGAFRGGRVAGTMIAVALLAALLSLETHAPAEASNLFFLQAFLPVWPSVALALAAIPLLVPRGQATHSATNELASIGSALRLKRLW